MTRVYNHIIRQSKELLMYTIDQSIEIPPWQIRSTNTVLKQYVTSQYHTLLLIIEGQMTWGVPWHEENRKLLVSKLHHIALFQIAIGFRFLIHVHSVMWSEYFLSIQNEFFSGMNVEFHVKLLFYKCIP